MGDGAQLAEQPVETVVGEDQRIAAGEEHVADLRRAADPVEGDLELAPLHGPVLVPHHALAQAEAAVDRALVVHAEGDAVGVDAHHVLHRRVGHLVQGIGETVGVAELGEARHHLAPDRALGIRAVHERRVVRSDHEAEALGEGLDGLHLVRHGIDEARQLRGAPDAAAELPARLRQSASATQSGRGARGSSFTRPSLRSPSRITPARKVAYGTPRSSARIAKDPSPANVGSGLISRKAGRPAASSLKSTRAKSRQRSARRQRGRGRRAKPSSAGVSSPGAWCGSAEPPSPASAWTPMRALLLEGALEEPGARGAASPPRRPCTPPREERLDEGGLAVAPRRRAPPPLRGPRASAARELRRMPFAVPSQRGFTKSGKPSASPAAAASAGALEGRVRGRGHARRRHDLLRPELVEGQGEA